MVLRLYNVPERNVAIVLGARVYADGRPSTMLADRLASALSLYRKGARQAGINAVGLVADSREYSHARYNNLREQVARGIAVVDSYLWNRQPRYLGDTIPITVDKRQTQKP